MFKRCLRLIIWLTLSLTHSATLTQTDLILTDTIPANTSLITATLPFTQVGNMLKWHFPDMTKTETKQVQMVIQAPLSGTMHIVNQYYGVKSTEFNIASGGPAITTTVGYNFFYPFVSR
jgi:hypothetical protein